MSRNSVISLDGCYEIAWGKDPVRGWFIQVFDLKADDPDTPIIDADQIWGDISTVEDMLIIADKYGAGYAVRESLFGTF